MFCPKCGTKNADDAHFCCKCGNSLSLEYQEQPVSQPTQRAAETARHKSKALFILLGVLFALIVIAVAAVFIIRGANESSLLSNVTTTIADGSEDDVAAYYDQYLPVSYADGGYMKECHYDQFHLEKGSDGNTFLVTGVLAVTDLTIEERPSYQIDISGTVTTDFFRTEYTVSWNYKFEEPEARVTYQNFIGVYSDGPIDDISSSALYITPDEQDENVLHIDYSSYRAGSGDFSVSFTSKGEWPAIKNSSIQFVVEPWFLDGTYQITLTFIPAADSSTGTDAIYMEGLPIGDMTFARASESSMSTAPSAQGSGLDSNGLLPSIPVDKNWPLGYFEKETGEALDIGYGSEDDVFTFDFYLHGQKYYYDSPTWTDPDLSFTVESLDVTSGAWLLRIDDTSITVMIGDNSLSIYSGDIGGISGSALTGTYYCKIQAIQP